MHQHRILLPPSLLRPSCRPPSRRPAGGDPHSTIRLSGGILAGLLVGGLLAAQPAAAAEAAPATTLLYSLSTRCALQGAAPVPCRVEALNDGGATLYRHRIGKAMETVRITDEPVTMAIWSRQKKAWEPLRGAAARFSTNTICFNGLELCVVNPNYLNSVREDRGNTRLQGRDLVMVHFGRDGRVDASCYDDACALLLK
jgi:hypothetical protein